MAERVSPTLKAVSDAVVAVAAELSVDEVLQRPRSDRDRSAHGAGTTVRLEAGGG
jgi:hypothetical protein